MLYATNFPTYGQLRHKAGLSLRARFVRWWEKTFNVCFHDDRLESKCIASATGTTAFGFRAVKVRGMMKLWRCSKCGNPSATYVTASGDVTNVNYDYAVESMRDA